MKRITTIALRFVFLVVFVFNTGHTLAQQETQEKQQTEKRQAPVQSIPRPLPDMTRRLQEANKAFRDAVASEMQEAARQAGVKIRTDNFVAIPFDDSSMVFVNAMIEGADRVSIEQLAKGADVLFIYSGAKLGFAGREIDPGFYVVRISQNPASGQWLAQFKNSQGRIVLETEATVERPDSNAAKMQQERLEAVKEVNRRGVPYILVDHGKITVKLAFYASPQESSQTQERSAKPASEFSAAVRPEAVPLKIEARVVNERNVEALGRQAGAIAEIEISFKVDLR
jgi:hypothetical protein